MVYVYYTRWYVTRVERNKDEDTVFGYSYWLALTSALLTCASIVSANRSFAAYVEYEYLPSLDDVDSDRDPRDILYPLRQSKKGGGR